jgi:decaprenyl-phosphate phosphoribosyltransferase
VADREADRAHPHKRLRPIAASAVSIPVARAVQVVLLALGLGAAASVGRGVLALTAGYLALTLVYSAWLKHVVILDAMAIAVGFVLRVEAGCRAAVVVPSVWIVLCTFLVASAAPAWWLEHVTTAWTQG